MNMSNSRDASPGDTNSVDGWDVLFSIGLVLLGLFVGIPLLGGVIAIVAAIGAAVLGVLFAVAPFLIGLAVIGALIGWLSDAL